LSGKNVSLDTIEHISAQPEMSQWFLNEKWKEKDKSFK
jgi:hypothetical protein